MLDREQGAEEDTVGGEGGEARESPALLLASIVKIETMLRPQEGKIQPIEYI